MEMWEWLLAWGQGDCESSAGTSRLLMRYETYIKLVAWTGMSLCLLLPSCVVDSALYKCG